ncbi:ABC transporter permease [Tanticharoenia sakaeratensis]|uniref:ABC transporter permease n=1 Tax=Tanticharoenia sakaeratensis NBRC 103193 TaxID=1231623 RepID=A0A0D6ML45_9PROT|nr:ABC transporter permease [Tanticharoenia sakaeratensis]GAN54201.1 ABC transporter permease [Tanticharoenia sakaeratensis NBRC 103193]GBQ19299.1 ABC transporter permease [Tanticharoenia sakaeratensis NBRC 103193]
MTRAHPLLVRCGFWLLAMGLVLALWQAVVMIAHVPPYIVPTPVETIAELIRHAGQSGALLWQTFSETIAGYLLGAAIGIVLAVAMSEIRLFGRLAYPALVTSQAIPIVGIAAPLVIVFGFGMTPKLIIVAWIVFFPVVVNVMDGLARVDPDQINLARLLGGSAWRTFLIVRLPACLGPLFSGLKIGASYAVTGAVIGEWTASSKMGLGTYLLSANAQMNTVGVYGAMMLMTLIGVGSFSALVGLEYMATPWTHRSTAPRWLTRLRGAPRSDHKE